MKKIVLITGIKGGYLNFFFDRTAFAKKAA